MENVEAPNQAAPNQAAPNQAAPNQAAPNAAPAGRREASKQATAAALRAAAGRLFAERGYDATTVRDVARAAGVTERTLYRYFDGKEGLIAEEYRAWLAILSGAIRQRPGGEPPFAAVRAAMQSVARQAPATGPVPLWLFSDRPSLAGLRRSAPRPLLRLEAAIAEAVAARLGGRPGSGGHVIPDDEFRAQVIARTVVAALRSAIIWHRQLRAAGAGDGVTVEELLDRAFAVICDEVRRAAAEEPSAGGEPRS
jgi:AcrR family transcriptional regulator